MRPLTLAPVSPSNLVYRIGGDGTNGPLPAKELVGSKAYNLMRLAARGLPVPPAFVLSTKLCLDYLDKGPAALDALDDILDAEVGELGARTGRHFGDMKRPLLLSVRSGAPVSMPGMMETVLNIGLTETTERALVRMTGNPRLAADCRRRLVQQYGEVVHAIAPAHFEQRLASVLDAMGIGDVDELDTAGLKQISDAYLAEFALLTGKRFPADPRAQLKAAILAVFRSWTSARAESYRKLNAIPGDLGTAALVQAMVFGNMGPASGSGVGFTRSPADGNNALYVDYLANAQGEDVVAGRRKAMDLAELERRAPDAYAALKEARPLLEQEFGDMQDFEFTVEEGRLYLLQTRTGKRTPLAALRIAVDLVDEGLIAPSQALERLATLDLEAIETVHLKGATGQEPIACGTAASTGIAAGAAVFDPERLAAVKRKAGSVILVREAAETSDIGALAEADALVTAQGARTSHAAVVARQLGKVCVVGCDSLVIEASGRRARFGAQTIEEGCTISVDGTGGAIFRGKVEVVSERPTKLLEKVYQWHGKPSAPAKRCRAPRQAVKD